MPTHVLLLRRPTKSTTEPLSRDFEQFTAAVLKIDSILRRKTLQNCQTFILSPA
jgi:hypothetical protein